MQISALFAALLVASIAAAATPPGCIWTDQNCACSLKKDIVASQTCWDPILPLVAGGANQPCSSRQCKTTNTYVCDCNGSSYCEISDLNRVVLSPVSPGMCVREQSIVKHVDLVAADITTVPGLGPGTSDKCVYTDNDCTCVAPATKHDCVDFAFKDPQFGNTCQVRDCSASMVCDCGGSDLCSKKTVTKQIWSSTGTVSGQPGMVRCEQKSHTFTQVTKKTVRAWVFL